MTKFDLYVCEYLDNHSVSEAINMLTNHADYINFIKYDHTVRRLKVDENKIAHINAMIKFLKFIQSESEYISDFKTMYFGG